MEQAFHKRKVVGSNPAPDTIEMSCPFCKNLEVQKRTIVRNRFSFAFPTNIPIVPGHVLICTKRHLRSVNELKPKEMKSIFDLQKKLKSALKKAFNAEGFNYAWNEGSLAGQNIDHFHLHMLPRKKNDRGVMKYEPRKFLYRPRSRKISLAEELIEVAELIKSKL